MTEVAKRIEKLRALMAEQNIDAYVVPTADFHQSEYVEGVSSTNIFIRRTALPSISVSACVKYLPSVHRPASSFAITAVP